MNTDAFSFSFKLDDTDEEPKNGAASPASSPQPTSNQLGTSESASSDPFAFDTDEPLVSEPASSKAATPSSLSLQDLDFDFGDSPAKSAPAIEEDESAPVIDSGSWLQEAQPASSPPPAIASDAPEELTLSPAAPASEEAELFLPPTEEISTSVVPVEPALASDEVPRFAEDGSRRTRCRVAVLGASGIGSNHARWFAAQGCEVVSFLGSSRGSIEDTSLKLKNAFNFEGAGFTDLGELLRETQPEMVCVATPNAMHYAQVLECLEAGAHVLCEKPLVYVPGRSARENRDGANELVRVAKQKGLKLATQLQYAPATAIVCKLAGTTPDTVGDCAMEIETINHNSPRNARDLWFDLGPHPLSVMQYLAGPNAQLVEELTQFQMREEGDLAEVMVRFAVQTENGRLITGRAIVRRFDGEYHKRSPRRRIALNGRAISYSGFKGSDGLYKAEFTSPDGYANHYPDPVCLLIENFVQACQGKTDLLTDGEFGAQNVDWLLRLTR